MSDIIKEGYLTKQGHFIKNWKKRWFILKKDGNLSYHSEKGKDAKGTIPVNNELTVTPMTYSGKEHTFKVECSDKSKPVYLIQAESEDDMDAWVSALQEAANPKEITSGVKSSFLSRFRSESKAAKSDKNESTTATPSELKENWPSYKNKKRGFVCEYPKRWNKKTSVADGHWQVEFANGKSADCPGHIAIQVQEVAKVVGRAISLQEYMDISSKFNEASPELKVKKTTKNVKLGPLDAFDMEFLVLDTDPQDKLDFRSTARSAISADGKMAYIATLVTPVESGVDWHAQFTPYFERVINSFQMTK